LLDEIKNTIFVASAMKQDQSVDTQLCKTFGGFEVNPPARRNTDLEIFKPPASGAASPFEAFDTLCSAVKVEREPEPSLRQSGGAAVGLLSMTTEDDLGVWSRHRPRHRIDSLKRDEATVIFRPLH
jgi:hypothetical protein